MTPDPDRTDVVDQWGDEVVFAALVRHGVVPVVVLDDPDRAQDLASALVDGGLPVAEVTLRTPGALAAIEVMARRSDLLIGAGTVLTVGQVDASVDAGARFVVSPGLDAAVVAHCRERGVLPLPGVVTPSEIMSALRLGLHAVKFFPAGPSGGAPAVAALAAPFPGLTFIPTGGVDEKSAPDYLALPCVAAVGGSWMVPRGVLRDGDFEAVRRLCRTTVGPA